MDFQLADTSLNSVYEIYIWKGIAGIGMSVSSNRAVLNACAEYLLRHGLPVDRDWVTKTALRLERSTANGHAIAAQDVVPIVQGGVVEVHTKVSGAIDHKILACDANWIREHLTYGYDPRGGRHDVPGLLADLFSHEQASRYVADISEQALRASSAILAYDIEELALAVREYVELFDEWMEGRLVSRPVREVVGRLEDALGHEPLAWKPLGGGAASSILVVGRDRDDQETAVDAIREHGWIAAPVEVAAGIQCSVEEGGGVICITAPHRIDLVGAADLGQDPIIGADGVCCSIAVKPRSELRLERPESRCCAPR